MQSHTKGRITISICNFVTRELLHQMKLQKVKTQRTFLVNKDLQIQKNSKQKFSQTCNKNISLTSSWELFSLQWQDLKDFNRNMLVIKACHDICNHYIT